MVRFGHESKARLPTLVTELGMVTEVNLVQPLKANLPILVTESGMSIEVKPVQLWKAYWQIHFTELGITVFWHPKKSAFVAVAMIQLLPLPSLNTILPLSTIIDVNPEQPVKAYKPISVTESGMVTEVKPVQSWKALAPI